MKSQSPSTFNMVACIAMMIVWGTFFCGMAIGMLLFIVALKDTKNAIQEASISAFFAACFVGAYVMARCIEKVIRSLDRIM